MATVEAMSSLSDKHRFVGRSIPEVAGVFADLVYQLGNKEDYTFRKRKLGMEAAINAVMLEFLDLSPEEQREVISRNLRRFEEMLGGDEGDPGEPARGSVAKRVDLKPGGPASDRRRGKRTG